MQRRVQQWRRGRGRRRIGGGHGGSGANCAPVPPRLPGIICPCCPLYLRDWRRRERHRLPLRWTRSKRASLQRGTPTFGERLPVLVPERSTRPEVASAPSAAPLWSALLATVSLAARCRAARIIQAMTSTDEWLRRSSRSTSRRRAWRTTPKARWSSSRMRWPARRCRSHVRRRKNNWEQATLIGAAPAERAAGRAALPALRRLRRLHAAAPARRRRRWRPSSARSRMRSGTSARSGRSRCCGRSKGRPGATASGPGCRCGTSRRRARCWSAFTSASRAMSPTCDSCEVLPPHVSGAAAAAARADRRHGAARPAAADRARGRRRRHGAGAAPSRAAASRRTCERLRALRGGARRRSGGCSRRARTRRSRSTTAASELAYALPEFGIRMPFQADRLHPGQSATSTGCWSRARCACSTPEPHERVIDWFCGLGNFTLPLATRAASVLGIEGSAALVARARDAARPTAWPSGRGSRRATCSS